MVKIILIFDVCLLIAVSFTDLLAQRAFLLAFIPFSMLLLIVFFERDWLVSGAHREFIVEFSFIAAGLIAAVI
jgi:hypothetical protein